MGPAVWREPAGRRDAHSCGLAAPPPGGSQTCRAPCASEARGIGRGFRTRALHTPHASTRRRAPWALGPGHGPRTRPRWRPLAASVLTMPPAEVKGVGCWDLPTSDSPPASSLGPSWLPSTTAESLDRRNRVLPTAAKMNGRRTLRPGGVAGPPTAPRPTPVSSADALGGPPLHAGGVSLGLLPCGKGSEGSARS